MTSYVYFRNKYFAYYDSYPNFKSGRLERLATLFTVKQAHLSLL